MHEETARRPAVASHSPGGPKRLAVRALETLLRELSSSQSPETPDSRRKPRELPRRIKTLSPNEEAKLIAAYRARAAIYELGDRFGIDRKTASQGHSLIDPRHGAAVPRPLCGSVPPGGNSTRMGTGRTSGFLPGR